MKPGDRVRFSSGFLKCREGTVTTNDRLAFPVAPSSTTLAVELDRPIDGVAVVQASVAEIEVPE